MRNHEWEEVEAAFRVWAFHVYYEKSFAAETDPTVRFVRALMASCEPIADRQAVIEWHRTRVRKKRHLAGAPSAPGKVGA